MTATRLAAMSDGELVGQVLAGVRAGYSVLIQRHQDRLLRYAVAMLSDFRLARTMVEGLFVDAYAALARCEPRDRFDLWTLRLLRRRLTSASDRSRAASTAPFPEVGNVDGGRGTKAVRRSSTLEEMGQLLSRPEEREAFFLRHVEGLEYEDIALIMELPPDAVRERVYRARAGLLIANG